MMEDLYHQTKYNESLHLQDNACNNGDVDENVKIFTMVCDSKGREDRGHQAAQSENPG